MSVRRLENGKWEMLLSVRRRGTKAQMQALELELRTRILQAGTGAGLASLTILEGLPRFLRVLRDKRRLAEKTVEAYRRDLSDLAGRLGGALRGPADPAYDVRLGAITAEAVEDLQMDLLQTYAAGTVNNRIARLKTFARWAIRTGRWDVRIEGVDWLYVEDVPVRHGYPEPVNEADLAAVLGALPAHVTIVLSAQAMTVDRPGAMCGLRVGDDTPPDNGRAGMLALRVRKGGAARVVSYSAGSILHDLLRRARGMLREALGRPARGSDPMFVTRPVVGRPRAWTTETLDHAVRYYLGRSELPPRLRETVPYTIRHSIITWAAQDGESTYHRQHLAGHQRETTCLVYTHTTGEEARAARERMEAGLGLSLRRAMCPDDGDDRSFFD